MQISIFELFSIGVGPSSSHTIGPMSAAKLFLSGLRLKKVARIQVKLHGSLAFTGKGHGTDRAILLGLEGEEPDTVDPNRAFTLQEQVLTSHRLNLLGKKDIEFHYDTDLIFDYNNLPGHANGLHFFAFDTNGNEIGNQIIYSIGGGFIATAEELYAEAQPAAEVEISYPFGDAKSLFSLCKQHQISIADLMRQNETAWRKPEAINQGLDHIVDTMLTCIELGLHTDGILPGGLNVKRRAAILYKKLLDKKDHSPEAEASRMNWLNVFAMAVNEQNAAGQRIVTAPTNGAAGIIPAVLKYYLTFHAPENGQQKARDFLLTAGAIGLLYKKNASISGAEAGCQGEVGVACSMAAGALAAVLGGDLSQIENAAEIGMEHCLGLTCDPVAGLVQIPCIERNAMAAVKAVNAATLALAEDRQAMVSLDVVIKTMRDIGEDMSHRYKETSQGGLAVNLPDC